MKRILIVGALLMGAPSFLQAEIANWDALSPCLEGAKIGRIEQAKAAARGELYQLTYRGLLDRINGMFELIPGILRQPKRSSPLQMIRKHLQKTDDVPFAMTTALEEDFLRFSVKVIENYNAIIRCLGGGDPYPLSKLMGAFDALSHSLPKYASMLLEFSEKKEMEKYQDQLRDDSKILLELSNDLTELSVALNDIVLNPGSNKCSTRDLMELAEYKYVPEHFSRPPSVATMEAARSSSQFADTLRVEAAGQL